MMISLRLPEMFLILMNKDLLQWVWGLIRVVVVDRTLIVMIVMIYAD